MRVGFLVAGNDDHHVAHVVPMAEQLARVQPGWSVHIFTTGKRAADEVDRCTSGHEASPMHVRLRPDRRGHHGAHDPHAVLRERDVLPALDMLVVTTASQRRRAPGQKLVLLWPGARDHADADAGWDSFDHILVPGDKTRAWLEFRAGIEPERISVVGCAKLETPVPSPAPSFAADGRRVVLYNPHHAPGLSSWFRWGRAILDWFVAHDDHLLIFAPHVRLFDQRFAWPKGSLLPLGPGRIDERYRRAPNILVDLGSASSTSGTYSDLADIYIGDAGGQLYEFIARPRPCVFLNPHGRQPGKRVDHFHNWDAGHVVDDVDLFGTVMDIAEEWHPDIYRPIQQEMVAYSISCTDVPAAVRAAEAIGRIAAVPSDTAKRAADPVR